MKQPTVGEIFQQGSTSTGALDFSYLFLKDLQLTISQSKASGNRLDKSLDEANSAGTGSLPSMSESDAYIPSYRTLVVALHTYCTRGSDSRPFKEAVLLGERYNCRSTCLQGVRCDGNNETKIENLMVN